MTSESPAPSPTPPDWPHCGHGADPATDPVGCRGIHVLGYTACLAHLDETNRAAYLATLAPGANVDHRGTPFTGDLLDKLIAPFADPATGRHRLGDIWFNEATFGDAAPFSEIDIDGDAWFSWAKFEDEAIFSKVNFGRDAVFGGVIFGDHVDFDNVNIGRRAHFLDAKFGGGAWFSDTTFDGRARFDRVAFGGEVIFIDSKFNEQARFDGATFEGGVSFSGIAFESHVQFNYAGFKGHTVFGGAKFGGGVTFSGAIFEYETLFNDAVFSGDVWFDEARFSRPVHFDGANFGGSASFVKVVFEGTAVVGPLACVGVLDLSEAVFEPAVTIEAAAAAVRCRRTRWVSTAALRLRYSAVDLSDAVAEYPVSVSARSRPFVVKNEEMAEPGLADPRVRVVSLRGVDAAHLVLADIDLADCRFAGTIHLDQLRLEGRYTLADAPSGLRWRGVRPVRWTPRRTLAEEHHWRATRSVDADGWTPAPEGEEALEPAALAPVYRQLRKSFEDSKHEPGAADFYYGEMEMRRHADDIPWAERALLTAYWALSGYGLRASRAVGWLLAAMTATVLAMMLWGLPQDSSKPISTGTLNGRNITMTTDTPDPVNPTGPWSERLSTERFEKSLRVVINSVVFRSSGQDLTTAGTYTEMASRFTEPVLLGLAILAVRGRVKR